MQSWNLREIETPRGSRSPVVLDTGNVGRAILIGLEPGTSYHDTVHDWCGTLFTGTFDFRISICTLPSYIPVDCGG